MMALRMIDQYATHHLCSYAEKVRTVLPPHAALIHQT
jgi:hypothetical protein